MTDEDLARAMMPDEPEESRLRYVRGLTPKWRAAYELMIEVAQKIERGERPAGVIICRRSHRNAR